MNSSQSFLEKLEELFHDDPFDSIEEELFQWFLFAYTGKGSGIIDLDTVNLRLFKDRLIILIDAVYQWHKE